MTAFDLFTVLMFVFALRDTRNTIKGYQLSLGVLKSAANEKNLIEKLVYRIGVGGHCGY